MNSYVLQAEDVAIHYGGVKALDGVGITLEKVPFKIVRGGEKNEFNNIPIS